MGDGAKIGHFNVCKGLDRLSIGEQSIISTMNWITGVPVSTTEFYQHQKNRNPSLYLGKHSAITNRHYIDCTDEIRIGNFTTIAGIGSQFLTHSINLKESIQDCDSISIGNYCFVGTNSVLLPGSSLGNNCILSASSLLNKKYNKNFFMYGGVPARPICELAHDMKYFSRTIGFVK
jgi:acetyltransferase-like isoleucine patch superfamily enzyme